MLKEMLKTYYGLQNISIVKKLDHLIIKTEQKTFFLYELISFEEINKAYYLSSFVDYTDIFVYNSFSNIITFIKDKYYVLLYRLPRNNNIFPFMNFYATRKRNYLNWRNLWIKKSNYYESFFSSIRGKYPIIDESIPYYMGLMEMGIYLLKDYDYYFKEEFIQHKIFNKEDYTNPFNLIEDCKERDFAEYLKYIFFEDKYQNIDISNIIQRGKEIFEYNLVIARMLLPNYYFNIVEDIILEKVNQNELKKIINKSSEYEEYLTQIIKEIEKIFPIKKYPILK